MAFLPEIKIDTEASEIILRGPNLTDDNVVDVLSKLPKCKCVSITGGYLGDAGIKALLSSGVINSVQKLQFYWTKIGDEGALALTRSSTSNSLVELVLYLDRVSADGLISIAEHLPGTKIMKLICYSTSPVSRDTRVHEAIYQAALKHKILEKCDYSIDISSAVGEGAQCRLQKVLFRNSCYIARVREELLEAVTFLGSEKEMNYPVKKLSADIMKKFEQFYFHPVLSCGLIEKDPAVCRQILNYISDNYFRITEIVRDSLECDSGSSPSLSSLPPELLRGIANFLKITDVKTESESETECDFFFSEFL